MGGFFPAEEFGGAFLGFAAQFVAEIGVAEQARDGGGEVRAIGGERHSAVARGFAVLLRAEIENGLARGHGFDERGMNATDFAGKDVKAGIAQELPITAAVDGAEENYAGVGSRFQALDVSGIVGVAADDDQRPIAVDSAIGVEEKLRVVLWFQAADIQDEGLGRRIEGLAWRRCGRAVCGEFGAVSDHRGAAAIVPPVVFFHDAGIGEDSRGSEGGEKFAQIQRRAAEEVPFLAFAIETVDIEHGGLAKEARNPGQRAIGDVADQHDIGVCEGDMDDGEKCVKGRVQVFSRDGRQDDAADAGRRGVLRRGERTTAVDGDFVPAGGQARGELLGERLEAAVARGNAARSENGDLHRRGDGVCDRLWRLVSQLGHYVWIRACCKLRGQRDSDELRRSVLAHIT